MSEKVIAVSTDVFKGKDVILCKGKGPDDPNCLEKNPPPGTQMIHGHICGSGCTKSGKCDAVFADPTKYPEFFMDPL